MTATFELDAAFCGAPTLAHGGVTPAVLDGAMACDGQWAVTTETSARFHRSVGIGHASRVAARVVDHVGDAVRTSARVVDRRRSVGVEAEAVFTALGAARAARLAGVEVPDAQRSFVND